MKFQDLTQLLEQDESIFKPRRVEDRLIRHQQEYNKQIQDYIKNGSKGDLYLYRAPIKALPNNLKVIGGNLGITDSQIKTLPTGLRVNGRCDLDQSSIEVLPEGLYVEEDLNIQDTPIKELPRGLHVGNDLFAFGSEIQKVSEDIKIGSGMMLPNTKLTEFPKTTQKEFNRIFVNVTRVTSVPEGLHVRVILNLDTTQLIHIPRDIRVDGILSILGTPFARKFTKSQLIKMYPYVNEWRM
jgi:hypothetical protein